MNKNTLRVVIPAVGILGSILIFSCAEKIAVTGSGSATTGAEDKVVFGESSIFIPGTAITKDDQKAMNAILAQHRTSLYKIDTYRDGALARTRGKLPDETVGQAGVLRTRANAKLRHLDGSAIQVGFLIGTHHVTPTPGSTVGTHHTAVVHGNTVGTQHHVTPTPGNTVGTQHTTAAVHGNNIGTQHHVTPTPGIQINPPSDEDYEDAAALVERLKPILKKYSQE